MTWIYLSPHFDDAALSCGGLIWEQNQAGEQVEVWTICAGSPPPGELSDFAKALHARWETGEGAVEQRRLEDDEACRILGATTRRFSVPDCIYRLRQDGLGPICDSENTLLSGFNTNDDALADELAAEIRCLPGAAIASPLALGNHIDHGLTRTAAERSGNPILYYPDYPYVLKDQWSPGGEEWVPELYPVSEEGLKAWNASIAAYRSQISTFWGSLEEMEAAIEAYHRLGGGARLWRNQTRAGRAG